jgi:peptidoglycan/LPS O-acetylase OafA/YrhL
MPLKRLPNLDVLRFVLSFFVLIFHLPQLSKNQNLPYFDGLDLFSKGTHAVYMFFVLSGFLIIGQIYNLKNRNNFNIAKFYKNRALRILPLYYLIVVFGLIFYNLILPFLNIDFPKTYSINEGILYNLFFLPNVFSKLYAPGGILEILWSIGIEEQFYLIVAPLLFVVNNKYVLYFILTLTVVCFGIYHQESISIFRRYNGVFFLLFSGGIISILGIENKLELFKNNKGISYLIIALTALNFSTSIFEFENPIWSSLFITILYPLFIYTISHNNFVPNIKFKWLNHLGKISYGLYMYHAIALNFVVFCALKIQPYNILNDICMIILINILTLIITIIIAQFSYKYYESYFLKFKNK